MQFLGNMKVGSKIGLLIAILLICIVSIAAFGILSLKNLNDEIDILYNRNVIALDTAKEANIDLISASRALRNMAITRHVLDDATTERYFNSFKGSVDNIHTRMRKLEELTVNPEGKSILANTIKAVYAVEEDWLKMINEVILPKKSTEEMVNGLVRVRPNANKADQLMTEFSEYMRLQAAAANDRTTDIYYLSLYISLGVLILAVLVAVCLGYTIMRSISAPLVEVAGKAGLVAQGDLAQDFSMTRKDEIGSLAESLQQMVANLRARIADAEQKTEEAAAQTVKAQEAMAEATKAQEAAEQGRQTLLQAAQNVDTVVVRLSAATEQLSAQIEQSSRSAEVQRERVTNSATAMEEMNATVLEVARNAGVASEGSDNARAKAVNGANIVKQSIEALNLVHQSTEAMTQEVNSLGEQAVAIGEIMTVISDVADQTNLLALNAAIEAARAGEAGRGFAVVADEVRKLAERTMTATKDVGTAVHGIQQGTQRSISAMGAAASSVVKAQELALGSGSALEEIVTESETAADRVRSIAAAAEEQSAASEEINRSLEEINRLAAETSTVMQQSAQAVSELAQQTTELRGYMEQLRN